MPISLLWTHTHLCVWGFVRHSLRVGIFGAQNITYLGSSLEIFTSKWYYIHNHSYLSVQNHFFKILFLRNDPFSMFLSVSKKPQTNREDCFKEGKNVNMKALVWTEKKCQQCAEWSKPPAWSMLWKNVPEVSHNFAVVVVKTLSSGLFTFVL